MNIQCVRRYSKVNTPKVKLMRDASINLRALPEQRDLIDHAANLLGMVFKTLPLAGVHKRSSESE
jgi:hypothetical protein